ncbi:hypothetical protein AAEU32_08050 [Pseudoalteromonas sp. SSDWG2]|uniref:hypothetical protein n=1 Tax=Pseudoalteromonas sp. SSDWG2 TaxID=3139391 RepID=UPI003BA9E257
MEKYKKAAIHVVELALASLVIAALLQLYASFIYDLVGFKTGFDHAIKLLYKYPKDVASIFAYFSAVVAVFGVSVVWFGSDLEAFLRKRVIVPAFEIAAHMLAMAAGVYVVWFITEMLNANDGAGFISSTFLSGLFAVAVMFLLALVGDFLAIYLESDFEAHMQKLAKYRVLFLLIIAAVLFFAVSHDVVWQYQPTDQVNNQTIND